MYQCMVLSREQRKDIKAAFRNPKPVLGRKEREILKQYGISYESTANGRTTFSYGGRSMTGGGSTHDVRSGMNLAAGLIRLLEDRQPGRRLASGSERFPVYHSHLVDSPKIH